jgi:regulator of sigma E protease
MNILLFIIILIVLVVAHELGHFIAAKLSKMRVEEFAFGLPPKVFSKKIGDTVYVFNLLPLGGYVKITGESFDEEERKKLKDDRYAFSNRPKILQIFVLSAGVFMNLVLAFFLFCIVNTGSKYINIDDTQNSFRIKNPSVIVSGVAPLSPAETSGIKTYDTILEFKTRSDRASLTSATSVVDFVKKHNDEDIVVVYKNVAGSISTSTLRAVYGVSPDKKSVGMSIVYGEKVKMGIVDTIKESAHDVTNYTKLTFLGVFDLFKSLFTGGDVLKSLSGPVGIAKMVGTANSAGTDMLLTFVAILSINLAVFNILPIPALDGGRIMYVLYEVITRKKINQNFQNYSNSISFILLIGLLVVVTIFDIFK